MPAPASLLADVVLDGAACVHLHGKGRKQRTMPLWRSTVKAVRAWLRLNPERTQQRGVGHAVAHLQLGPVPVHDQILRTGRATSLDQRGDALESARRHAGGPAISTPKRAVISAMAPASRGISFTRSLMASKKRSIGPPTVHARNRTGAAAVFA